jgi:hypothetical protein
LTYPWVLHKNIKKIHHYKYIYIYII